MTFPTPEGDPQLRRWWIALAILVGTWSGTSLNSMMPIALPSMLVEFDIGVDLGVWIISVFVLLSAVFMPISGWLGDRYGYRRVYLVGFSGVVLSAWAAALAPGFGWLIAARTLQGVFNSVGLPSTMGIISSVFSSRERGLAMGVWAAVNGASHGLGPAISGLLVENFGWPAPFWLNGSTALLAVVLITLIVPSDRRNDARPFDLVGAGALTLAMLTLMFTLRQGGELGWGSAASIGLWLVFGGLLLLFVITERRVAQPFVQLRLFANRHYSIITAVSSAQFLVLVGLQLLLSLYLIQFRGLAEGLAGLLILPLASTLAVFSPLAGRIADWLGFRPSMIIGLAVVTLAVGSMALWDAASPNWLIVATLVVTGLGMGFAHSQGATGVSLVVRRDERGLAMGIYNMLRFVCGTFGVNVLGIIVEAGRAGGVAALQPFRVSFYLLAAVSVLGLLLAVALPRSPLAVEPAAAPVN
ncbi:MAG: MFS transporter [Anaerolineae bacterium]